MEFIDIERLIEQDGLRLVIVRGTHSPWSQAAKAMMEYKDLDFVMGGFEIGAENTEIVAWSHQNSGPVLAWNDEPPLSKWYDILFLLERLAPHKPLVPAGAQARAWMMGLSHEICGELGIGWNIRLQLFRPIMASGAAPEPVQRMAVKYRYNEADVALANGRLIAALNLLARQLDAQRERGSDYFIGDSLTALDFYWAAFCNLADLPPPEQIPLSDDWRALFRPLDPAVAAALAPCLLEHRERMMRAHFKLPMAF